MTSLLVLVGLILIIIVGFIILIVIETRTENLYNEGVISNWKARRRTRTAHATYMMVIFLLLGVSALLGPVLT